MFLYKKRKKKEKRKKVIHHYVNWNYIITLIAILTLFHTIWTDHNARKEVDFENWKELKKQESEMQKSEIYKLKEKNKELKESLNPNFYQIVNEQESYFKKIIEKNNARITFLKKLSDSLNYLNENRVIAEDNSIILTKRKASFLVRELKRRERDSLLLAIQNQRIGLMDSIITTQNKMSNFSQQIDTNKDSIISNLKRMVQDYNKMEKSYEDYLKRSYGTKKWIFWTMGALILIIAIWNKENTEKGRVKDFIR